ncbi:MAG TPA: hypothetical protein VD837_07505 [Terriglobales bacterium]|nr:hypothetical protein [Terriglobales bacterium]
MASLNLGSVVRWIAAYVLLLGAGFAAVMVAVALYLETQRFDSRDIAIVVLAFAALFLLMALAFHLRSEAKYANCRWPPSILE